MIYREYKLLKSLVKSVAKLEDQFVVYLRDSFIEAPSGEPIQYTDGTTRMMADIRSLAKRGYIEYANGNEYVFCLTNKGLYFWKNFLSKCILIVLTSVILPIIVSVITTLITLWLKA